MQNRKPTRLQNFDYNSNGSYFITICADKKQLIFGDITDGSVNLNSFGYIASEELTRISERFTMLEIDHYVIMPNHVHTILTINNAERSRPFPTIPAVMGLYKSGVSKRIHQINPGINVWQKSFYDHIIRNENEYLRVWKYIDENPLKWESDEYY